jgi:phosphate transport system protein
MTAIDGPRSSYREHLAQLRNTVLRMGTFSQDMLAKAMQALMEQNVELAREVHHSDDIADDFDFQIEKESLSLLVSQQPVSGDLRTILGALRIGSDLERIADYAKDIAKIVLVTADTPWFKPLEDIRVMGDLAVDILRQALRALADQDVKLAREVAARDEELDDLWHKLWVELNDRMKTQPEIIPQASYLLLVARYLERIGDHTVNVLERLNYVETGKLEPLA